MLRMDPRGREKTTEMVTGTEGNLDGTGKGDRGCHSHRTGHNKHTHQDQHSEHSGEETRNETTHTGRG